MHPVGLLTVVEKVEDDRLTNSFPTTPVRYKQFEGFDAGAYGENFDNVYADQHPEKKNAEFSELAS